LDISGDPLFNLNSLGHNFFDSLQFTELYSPPIHFSDGECPIETHPCDPHNPYRSFSGYCNNLNNPNFGKELTTFQRLMPAAYENGKPQQIYFNLKYFIDKRYICLGINHPRVTSVTGVPLPSARLVSAMSHPDISHLHGRYTLMLMQFAQILDHDITFTPVHKGKPIF